MIHYLTSARNAGAMQAFLAGDGRAMAGRITVLAYEQLMAEKRLQLSPGAYIFTSIGASLGSRHPPSPVRLWAMRLHDALLAHLGPERVLNDPLRSLRRFELLRRLADDGLNRFQVQRADESEPALRFPVFLRRESGTLWEAPDLLGDRAAFASALASARQAGAAADLMAIEFCETADARGIRRKYGCFVVGDRIVPRHLFLSRDWLVKKADIVDADALAEEMDFLATNPHADALRNVCRLAAIAYGRIDYAIVDGAPQIWEMNTTPQIVMPPGGDAPGRAPVHAKFAQAFMGALDALDRRQD